MRCVSIKNLKKFRPNLLYYLFAIVLYLPNAFLVGFPDATNALKKELSESKIWVERWLKDESQYKKVEQLLRGKEI